MALTNPYDDLLVERENLFLQAEHFSQLNMVHDQIIHRAVEIAVLSLEKQGNSPPAPFSFFMLGSAGRSEQGLWSDQDHGIIYFDQSASAKHFFLQLGKEITKGLYQAGYPLCDGGVMSSNPTWCQPLAEWQQQLNHWVEQSTWEAIRYLLIFMDARVLYGSSEPIEQLKAQILQAVQQSSDLLLRMTQNTERKQKGIGLLGNILVENYGTYTGCINLKERAILPFVNYIRLLSIKEGIQNSSTAERLNTLITKEAYRHLAPYPNIYKCLLDFRFQYQQKYVPIDYQASHYIKISHLTQMEEKELKYILKMMNKL